LQPQQHRSQAPSPAGLLDSIAVETDLDGIQAVAEQIVAGRVRGRTLVRVANS
jgi:hypothetical protein